MPRAASTFIVLAALAAAAPAMAQIPFPVLGVQTNQASTNTYRHLPSRELGDGRWR